MGLKGRTLWLLMCLLLALGPAQAASPVVRVTGPDPVAGELAGLLAARAGSSIEVRRDGEVRTALRVAVGAREFRSAVEAGDVPVVGVALSRHSYLAVTGGKSGRHTAVFWEPDPQRQLHLARALMPGARRVGVLLADDDPVLLAGLRREAARLKLEVVAARAVPGESLTRHLNSVLDDSDFLLGIDDPGVFSPATAKSLLLTSYRHGKPVIGPSGVYVDAGSIASLSVTLGDVADTLVAWLPALLANPDVLPPPRYTAVTAVRTNTQVGRSLRLAIPPQETLEMLMKASGDSP